jgi:hypothetical protein
MTAHISRLSGAILLECDGQFLLIGNTKSPCNWLTEGFEAPAEVDAVKQPVLRLTSSNITKSISPVLIVSAIESSGESLAKILADRFLIRRNGSVSERLWRIVTGESDESSTPAEHPIQVNWLVTMPSSVWEIIRETALKCL